MKRREENVLTVSRVGIQRQDVAREVIREDSRRTLKASPVTGVVRAVNGRDHKR